MNKDASTSTDVIYEISSGKIIWCFMKDVMKCALMSGGCLFGGYPRDLCIHDHFAQKFYNDPNVQRDLYKNTNYMPEYKDRLLIPNDMDIYMKTSNINKFLENLKDNQLKVISDHSADINDYFNNEVNNEYKLRKMTIGFNVNNALKELCRSKQFMINVDVIHSNNEYLELKPDMECNGLIINKNNIELCNYFTKFNLQNPFNNFLKLELIMKDIIDKKTTILIENLNPYRIKKLLNRGWKIESKNISISKVDFNPASDVCSICLSEIDSIQLQLKGCCNNNYHSKCIEKSFEIKKECPKCRHCYKLDKLDKALLKFSI